MSVLDAINGHAAQPFRAYVENLFVQRGLKNANQFANALAKQSGRTAQGMSGNVSSILNGRHAMTVRTAEQWSAVLGVTPQELLKQAGSAAKPKRKRRKSPGKVTISPVAEIVDLTPSVDMFALSMNANGTANVRIDVRHIPHAVALRLLAELPKLLPQPKGDK